MNTALLSTTYFGPVQWYQKLYRYDAVLIEACESFVKQTYRNRCVIATAQGPLALTVPVAKDERLKMKDEKYDYTCCDLSVDETNHIFHFSSFISHLRISDHGNWRHLHWQALQSAYGDSPFFEYYEDDLRPFFTEHRWERLLDFNEDIRKKMCELLDIHPNVQLTTTFNRSEKLEVRSEKSQHSLGGPSASKGNNTSHLSPLTSHFADFRYSIHPKHPQPDADFKPRPYYQVFAQNHGFIPNLSILDLLFNMGPESIFYL